jgi:hypothetical protein
MIEPARDALEMFCRQAGFSHGELWLRYFELGGMSTGFELEAFLYGALVPTDHDHDVIAHALNEHFREVGGDHPVPYAAIPREDNLFGLSAPSAGLRSRGRKGS